MKYYKWVETSKINVFDFASVLNLTITVSAASQPKRFYQCFGKGPWWKSPLDIDEKNREIWMCLKIGYIPNEIAI